MTNPYRPFVDLIRPYNALTPVLAFCIGYFFYRLPGGNWGVNFILGIVAIFCIHSFATIRNDINDCEIDKINSPHKPLVNGGVTTKQAKYFAVLFFCILLATAILDFPYSVIFIGLMLILPWLYNEPPFYFSRNPFSAPIVLALMYSTLPFLYGYLFTHASVNLNIVGTLAAWFLVRISISVLKDFKDARGDALSGKKTFYLSFGQKATAYTSLLLGTVGLLGVLFFAARITLSWWLLVALAFALWSIYRRYKLLKADDIKLKSLFLDIFFGQNQFDLIYLIWVLAR